MSTAPILASTPDRPFGALLRHYREAAGLSQEALAERAGMSARAIRYLERGGGRPYPDSLRRLATALALAPAHQEALVEAAYAPGVLAPGPGTAAPAALPPPSPLPPAPVLVGRTQELAVLRGCLTASLAGQGGLVLLSGEAGIGKTALAEALCREAAQQGALVLIGRCYDLSETPPYGPWSEARAQFPPAPDLPPLPSALQTAAQSPGQFFAEVRDFFAAAAARQPLVLVLEDQQWVDAASLDLLRFLARSLRSLRFLILVSYRSDELSRHHPLSQLLPLLVREAHATRVAIAPLPRASLQALVHARYALPASDEERLVQYLTRRSEGNALFATELLHALEEAGALAPGGAEIGDLDSVAVPMLLRQVVEGRVVRLGPEAEQLLGIAAVVGQETSLDVWASVAAVHGGAVEEVAERALAAALLVETRGGEQVGFAHALIREALYAGIPAMRRRRIHRRVGEVLAAARNPIADAVAYHYQQAQDERAAPWLMRAGWQAYRTFAYETARARFLDALPLLAEREQARALFALAALSRYQARGIRYAEEAVAAAQAAGDDVLAALAQFRLGLTLCYHGRVGDALTATETARRSLDAVPDDALPDFYGLNGLTYAYAPRREYRASVFAYGGGWRSALELLGGTPETLIALLNMQQANGAVALWYVSVLLGRLGDAQRAAAASIALFAVRGDDLGMLAMRMTEGCTLLIPFMLDDAEARRQFDAQLAHVTRQVEERLGTVPPHLNQCPLLIVAGRWTEARMLWAQRDEGALSIDRAWNLPHVGALARAQGALDEAWALVREGLPDGPQTEPGTTHFTAVDLYCLAARLALDAGDHALARRWLEAHARWLAWAGEEVRWGRANGRLAWAEYYHAVGESAAGLRHAEQALAEATTPRQPLMLLAGQRLLGDLLREAGRDEEARAHLDTALALADACGAPYERALTLLAGAALDATSGHAARAGAALDAVRALCAPLGAGPALARADALAATVARNRRQA